MPGRFVGAKAGLEALYSPAVAGTATIGSVVLASRSHSKRTAAAVSAYAITEKAFVEYKGKVIDELGKHKEQKIRDEMAEDKLSKSPLVLKRLLLVAEPCCVASCIQSDISCLIWRRYVRLRTT